MSYNIELFTELNQLGEPGSRERDRELLPLVAAGDEAARTQMIHSGIALACCRAEFYIRSRLRQRLQIEFLRDDLISAGFLGVVKAVNLIAHGTPTTNVTAMISYWINREIMRVIDKEVDGYPDDEAIPPAAVCIRPPVALCEEDGTIENLGYQRTESGIETTGRTDPGFRLVDLRDLIYSCCDTEQERTLIRLREQSGIDCAEIAPLLGVSKNTAYRMLNAIEQRFNRKSRL
jgi:RNA polymerase sigma factor (sigma-70 family)